jgi:hypothetical protein
LVKKLIDGMFWFKDDLSFINNKNTFEQHQEWWKMGNNKMVMNNLARVSKRHVRNTKGTRLDMKIVFLGHRGYQRGWRLKALDTMLEDTKGVNKCIGDITSIKVKNINLFLNQWLLQNMVWRTLGTLERLNYFFKQQRAPKKTSCSRYKC